MFAFLNLTIPSFQWHTITCGSRSELSPLYKPLVSTVLITCVPPHRSSLNLVCWRGSSTLVSQQLLLRTKMEPKLVLCLLLVLVGVTLADRCCYPDQFVVNEGKRSILCILFFCLFVFYCFWNVRRNSTLTFRNSLKTNCQVAKLPLTIVY